MTEEQEEYTATTPLDNLIKILTWISDLWKNDEITTHEMGYLVKQRCDFFKKETNNG